LEAELGTQTSPQKGIFVWVSLGVPVGGRGLLEGVEPNLGVVPR
jgi:hypothetical protein